MLRFTAVLISIGLFALAAYGGAALLWPGMIPVTVMVADVQGVPAEINHQGVISVGGTRFTGTGLFKFAILNGTDVVRWSNAADVGPADGVPDAAVSLAVVDGVYSIRLGNTALANMAAIPSNISNSDPDLKLRVWFDDGTANGEQQLSPDHPLGTAPYAFTVADDAIAAGKLASDSASLSKVSGGTMAVASGNVELTGQIKIAGGSPGTNKVLTSDAAGLGNWQNAPSTQFKAGFFWRDLAGPLGNQSITGVGFQPRAIIFEYTIDAAAVGGGMVDSSGNAYGMYTGVIDAYPSRDYAQGWCIYLSNAYGTNNLATLVSFDADGFTLNWTRAGAPTGTGFIRYMAMR